MNGSTVSIADLRAAATVDIVAEGADPVGSFMLRCVRYALATMTVMIALTVGLGLYAGAKHAFPPSVTSSDSVAQRECSGRRLACIGAQFVDTVYTMVGAAAGLLEVASRSSDACMAAAFAIGGAMYAMSIYGWTDVAVALVQAFVGKLHAAVHNGWKFTVFICMIYLMVAGGDGASCDDLIAYNELVRTHAGSEWFMFHADVASRMSELWSNTMLMPAVHSLDELVLLAEADGRDPTNTVVIDTGARRSVIRDPKCFNKATCRPAPFKVRGVLGASGQPDFMGNATIYMPVSDTATGAPVLVEAVELIDAVCIPLCPHDIVAVGPLLWGGASLWLAPGEQVSWLRFASGAYARLYNRAIIFADACAPKGTSTVAVASDAPQPFVPPQIVAGSGGRKEAFYMCSGKSGNPTGFAAWWNHLSSGGRCHELDKVNSGEGDMLLNTSFAPFYANVRDGKYHAGILTPPCGQFNPRRIAFPDERYPLLRSVADFGMGLAGLSDRFQRSVDAVNVLAVRVCLVARRMFDLRRPWVIENPPTRSDETGVFRRFFRQQLQSAR